MQEERDAVHTAHVGTEGTVKGGGVGLHFPMTPETFALSSVRGLTPQALRSWCLSEAMDYLWALVHPHEAGIRNKVFFFS